MLNPDLTKWIYGPTLEGLLFFAQAVDEMLFDYTLDSYRVPTMNTHSLCQELSFILKEVATGTIDENHIEPVVAELKLSLQDDKAMQKLIGPRFQVILSDLRSTRSDPKKLRTIASYLLETCSGKSYLRALIDTLVESIANPKEKEAIYKTTRRLIVELLDEGYSRQSIYFRTHKFFFARQRSPLRITSTNQIVDFVQGFDCDEKSWTVIARVSPGFGAMREVLQEIGITVSDVPPAPRDGGARESRFLEPNATFPLYAMRSNFKALDEFDARDRFASWLRAIRVIQKQHSRREDFGFSPEMAVYKENSKRCILASPPLGTLNRGAEIPADSQQMRRAMKRTSSLPREFLRMLELHATAVDSTNPDTQFLTLWSALEGVLPIPKDRSRVTHIMGLLEPVLCRGYIRKLLDYLAQDLRRCCQSPYSTVIDKIVEGQTEEHKLAALISIQSYEPLRDELYAAVGNNVLLRNRIFVLKKSLDSPVNISKTVATHWQRVSWHLQRMYRARNLYVHSAKTVPHMTALLDSLHSYVDLLIHAVEEMLVRQPSLSSARSVMYGIAIEYHSYRDLIERAIKRRTPLDPNNYLELLQMGPSQ